MRWNRGMFFLAGSMIVPDVLQHLFRVDVVLRMSSEPLPWDGRWTCDGSPRCQAGVDDALLHWCLQRAWWAEKMQACMPDGISEVLHQVFSSIILHGMIDGHRDIIVPNHSWCSWVLLIDGRDVTFAIDDNLIVHFDGIKVVGVAHMQLLEWCHVMVSNTSKATDAFDLQQLMEWWPRRWIESNDVGFVDVVRPDAAFRHQPHG